MTASHAALVSTNAPLALSLKAKSTPSTPTFALTAVLALMFAPLALSLRVNNHRGTLPNKLNSFKLLLPLPEVRQFFVSLCFASSDCTTVQMHAPPFRLSCKFSSNIPYAGILVPIFFLRMMLGISPVMHACCNARFR